MTIERLKALLDSGAITQEEYDEMAANIKETVTETDTEPEKDTETVTEQKRLMKILQSHDIFRQNLTEKWRKNARKRQSYSVR